jgi:hypothetical protein
MPDYARLNPPGDTLRGNPSSRLERELRDMQFSLKPVFIGWLTIVALIPLQLFFTLWSAIFFGGLTSFAFRNASSYSLAFFGALAFFGLPLIVYVGKRLNLAPTNAGHRDDRIILLTSTIRGTVPTSFSSLYICPICMPLTTRCLDKWRVQDFLDDVHKVVAGEVADLTKLKMIVSGDMNELGEDGGPADFAHIFKQFGEVKKSSNVETCCEDNGFSASYHHFVTNSGTISEPVIIDNGDYPIDPRFNERHPDGKWTTRSIKLSTV